MIEKKAVAMAKIESGTAIFEMIVLPYFESDILPQTIPAIPVKKTHQTRLGIENHAKNKIGQLIMPNAKLIRDNLFFCSMFNKFN